MPMTMMILMICSIYFRNQSAFYLVSSMQFPPNHRQHFLHGNHHFTSSSSSSSSSMISPLFKTRYRILCTSDRDNHNMRMATSTTTSTTRTSITNKAVTSTVLFQSSSTPHPHLPGGLTEGYLRGIDSSNNDNNNNIDYNENGSDDNNNSNIATFGDTINGDLPINSLSVTVHDSVEREAVEAAIVEAAALAAEGKDVNDNHINDGYEDYIDGKQLMATTTTTSGIDHDENATAEINRQQQQKSVDEVSHNHDGNESEEEVKGAESDSKFYSLWQRRPGRSGESQGNSDNEDGSSSSESNNSNSKNKITSQEETELQEASARKWTEWMISGRRLRDENNRKGDVFNSPSMEEVALVESSALSTLPNESSSSGGSGGIESSNSIRDTATTREILPMAEAVAVSTSGDDNVEISKDNNRKQGKIFSVASPSSAGASSGEEIGSNSIAASSTAIKISPSSNSSSSKTLDESVIVENKEASTVRGRAGWGVKLFPDNYNRKSFWKILPGKGIMDKTITMMTMRRQKGKQPMTTKENEDKSIKLGTKSISKERRREQLREPGRISACDWRQNIINLPNSTILRDVRDPVTWVFVWATLWSIIYECLKRMVEASSSSVAAALSPGGGDRRAAATILGPSAARWLSAAAWSAKHMCLPTVQHTMMVSAVSLLLVFRTNSAYQRFAEGRKIWNDIVDTSRDFSRMVKLYEFAIGTSKCRRINSLLASFPYLLRHRIRPSLMTFYRVNDSNIERDPEHSLLLYPDESLRDTDPELIALAKDEEETGFIRRKTRELCWVDRRTLPWKLIPGSALELCARAQNRPLWVCDRMAKELAVVEDSTTKFTNRERMALIGYVDKLSRSIGACERIHQTVVPMNYARHALRSLTVWLWTLPFVLVKDLGLLTGPVVAILSWILVGVFEIGSRIEDPFQGTLRLSVYCDAIRRDVLADAIARDTAFILEEEGKSSSEKEGEYDAIFELDSESEEYDGDDVPPKKKKQMMWSFPGDIRL